jgi:hypothetical protein
MYMAQQILVTMISMITTITTQKVGCSTAPTQHSQWRT